MKSQGKKIRSLRRLILVIDFVIVAGILTGCWQSLRTIPEELIGKYETSHPKYKDQFFELRPVMVTFRFSGGKVKHYNVKRVNKEIIENRLLYTILCSNEAEREEFNFAFYTDFANKKIVHFKNKPQVAWKRQQT